MDIMDLSSARCYVDGSSVSVSEPSESSSQLSDTVFDLGACVVFYRVVEESSRCLETMSIVDYFGVAVEHDACCLPSSLGVLFMEAMVRRVPVQIDEYRYPGLRGVYWRKRGNRNQGEHELNEGTLGLNYSTV